jgi:ribonuclease BN (tRNA processing enzyme)
MLLLDCSAAVPARMAQERLPWPELDAIWISHFHMDHCGGLGPLLAGIKHSKQMQQRTKPLKIYGPNGTRQLIDRFNDVHNFKLYQQPFPVSVVDIEEADLFEIMPSVEAVSIPTPHTSESRAIRIRDRDGTSIVYSGDTGFSESVASFAVGVDLFLLECAFVRDKTKDKHIELAEAVYMIRKSGCERAMLTHFYPEWDEVDFRTEVEKYDPRCEVVEAVDGLTVEI